MAKTLLPALGGGDGKSQLTVMAPAGSQLVLRKQEQVVKTAVAENGQYVFTGLDVGSWYVEASLDGSTAVRELEITREEQRYRYAMEVQYVLRPADFDLAAYGVKGTDYAVVRDDGTELPEDQWNGYGNWKLRLLKSGILRVKGPGRADVFLAGGGAGGSPWKFNTYFGPGGGGGYTAMGTVTVEMGMEYPITVGAGGSYAMEGQASSALGLVAAGGKPGVEATGGDGGSGGSSGGTDTNKSYGGSDGSDGSSINGYAGGIGQHTTTREFGEAEGTLYCSGGKCNSNTADDLPETPNSGNGGAGGYTNGSVGSSGIVVIRNAR